MNSPEFKIHDVDVEVTSKACNYTIKTQKLEEYNRAFDSSALVSRTDTSGKIIYANKNLCDLTGYTEDELLGNTHAFFQHPDTPSSIYSELWSTISSGHIWSGVLSNITKDQKTFVTNNSIVPIKDSFGQITEYICIRYDITKINEQQNTINNQFIDKVTQLPNSTKLIADSAQLEGSHIAVLTIPELNKIQSTYTIECYNKLIRSISDFIGPQIPNNYDFYRLSENMFAISTGKNGSFGALKSCCYSLQFHFDEQQVTDGNTTFKFSIVIGLAKSIDVDNTLINAKLALSYALDSGQNISTYRKENRVYEKIINAIDWGNKIRSAIANDNVCIFGQKIVDIERNQVCTEVLMRIYDPESNEYISPYHFLSIAKKANLYHQLSQIVITKAIKHFSQVNQCFSINISSEDIKNKQTKSLLIHLIHKYQIGHHLTIELVESELCNINNDKFIAFIEQLKRLGCRIAIDDFGSGYSNFDYLLALPIDTLKIDGSLVKGISNNEKHKILVKAIINLSHQLNLKVVSEFIANEEDFAQISTMKADYYQGYLFHQPEKLTPLSCVK